MKYTNKYNFPDYVREWLEFDDYDHDPDTISATTLMKPARSYALGKQHEDELEIDISDLIASRYGTAIHASIEQVKLTDCVQEQRLKTTILDKTITGKFDILREIEPGKFKLIDMKSTSVWNYIYDKKNEDYITQLSIYRYLGHQNDINIIDEAEILMVFTDWSSSKAKKDPEYPETRLKIKPLKLWSLEETKKYIEERVAELETTRMMEEKDMPECTSEELWSTPDSWAIMKDGRKTAVKVHETEIEAKAHLKDLDDKHTIEYRPGKAKRCKYCAARNFCSQYKRMIENGQVDEE